MFTRTCDAITLDDFSAIMGYPPIDFMGIMSSYNCNPLTRNMRNRIVLALESALNLMSAKTGVRGKSLFDRGVVLQSQQPYFMLADYGTKTVRIVRTLGIVEITDDVIFPEASTAAIACGLTLTASETIADVRLIFSDLAKQFGAKIEYTHTGNTLSISTMAYNLIDISIFSEPQPADNIPYLPEIYVDVYIVVESTPDIIFAKPVCATNDLCATESTKGCLLEGRNQIYDVIPLSSSNCSGTPLFYQLAAIQTGLWDLSLVDAIISLMNSRIPMDYCGCDPLINQRFRDDNGVSARYEKVYPYSYSNGFGILTPGAQYAWKTLETLMSNTIVIKS